ncbi:MAG: DNA-3-methyladenine glycosylase family protein [Gemmatimonadales bacterium]
MVPCLWAEDGVEAIAMADVLAELARRDPVLGRHIAAVGPFALTGPTTHDGAFAALTRAIVYQQLSGRAASTILGRVLALFPGERFPSPDAILATHHRRLRRAGLSEAKARAIRDLARHASIGTIPSIDELRSLPADEVVERLTVVRGVGQWTVEMLLIFRLGHPDVLPVHDLGVRKGLARLMGRRDLPDAEALLRRGERWRPWRSVASWYLWRAAELPRPRSRPPSR